MRRSGSDALLSALARFPWWQVLVSLAIGLFPSRTWANKVGPEDYAAVYLMFLALIGLFVAVVVAVLVVVYTAFLMYLLIVSRVPGDLKGILYILGVPAFVLPMVLVVATRLFNSSR